MDPAPFVSPDADVTLHAGDGTTFRVHSCILKESSPFFRDLFTLPQPNADKDADTAKIDISEGGEVVHTLLRLIYPIENPSVETLSHLSNTLGAAIKYDMNLAINILRVLLVSPKFVETEPCRVFAIACRYNLEEEAKLASAHTLNINILEAPLTEELKFITAFDYHRLLNLHRTRGIAAQALLVLDRHVRCQQCSGVSLSAAPRWWTDWSLRAREELRHRPTSDVIFSLRFLAQSAQSGCLRCGGSILDSHGFLFNLKKAIDDLPATI